MGASGSTTFDQLSSDKRSPEKNDVGSANQICPYPLTGAVESTAKTLSDVIQETLLTTTSERQGRAIDKDAGGAGMEKKKQEGYF